jgi:hypothetical protein
MKTCLKCENTFPTKINIDGKIRNLDKRKYCIECSPFGSHNTKSLHVAENNLVKICSTCNKEYQGGHSKHKDKCGRCYSLAYRTKTKQKAIDYKGSKCSSCGYDKYFGSLQFHHVYPEAKSFNIGDFNFRKFDSLVEELDKCILVCSNCHGEIHAGLIDAVKIYEEQQATFPKYVEEVKPEKIYHPIFKISKRPDKEVLEKLVWEMSCVKIGEIYGVSDNAVNKWCKFYEIKKPGRGDWEKIKYGKLDKPEF